MSSAVSPGLSSIQIGAELRMPVAVAHVAIAEAHRARQQPVADHAAVDEQELAVRLRARRRGQPDPPLDRKTRVRMRNEARAGNEVRPDELRNARLAVPAGGGGRQRELIAAVVR